MCVNIFLSYTDHICLQIGKAVQKMNDLSRPVYLKSMDEEKHKPNDVLWKQAQKSDFLMLRSVCLGNEELLKTEVIMAFLFALTDSAGLSKNLSYKK